MERLKKLVSQSIVYEPISRRSGGRCDVYVDSAHLLYHPEVLTLAAEKMLSIAYERRATHIGGEATSALPLIGAIMTLSVLRGQQLHGFMIRKKLKSYGKSSLIEGDLPSGSRVLLIDDVTGRGSAAVRCCKILRELAVTIVGYSSIVDRQEQAEFILHEQFGVDLLPLILIDECQRVQL
ncbi:MULTISPECIES: orotate phosphoribosyltransferase [unclassified Paenibacillus]|uniref:orotate phosphoribosyltransferase n=1 Tax=unclassified Paenibacillus TaxID=185978 RepID=UPI0030F8DC03